ncbi:hypothetical protein ASG42_30235 [Rhizobium sp. Leaf391]|nr:hypothetical protein ASG42_30235 [Rhizobium sp. Leaf391]
MEWTTCEVLGALQDTDRIGQRIIPISLMTGRVAAAILRLTRFGWKLATFRQGQGCLDPSDQPSAFATQPRSV